MPEVGDTAPDFTAETDGGGTVRLSDLRGRKVVLYFYPRDNTSGCTAEACAFRDAEADFAARNAVILGVSPDSVASHDRFKAKHGLPFRLVPTAGTRSPRPTDRGGRSRCTAGVTWESSARPS